MRRENSMESINPSLKVSEPTERSHYLTLDYAQLATHYDPDYRALWCTIKSAPLPAFTPTLLSNIRTMQDAVAQYCLENPTRKPKYLIWRSDNKKVFSLGLDLTHIYQSVINQDIEALENYIQSCIDIFYINLMKLDISPLITMTLIRGKAHGGGFEAALSSDIIVTENNARCCFPEIRYHLFPSMGTLKMLLRRFPPMAIEPLLFEGRLLNLEKLQQLGFIETATNMDHGEEYIREKIRHLHQRHQVYAAMYEAKIRHNLITYQELEEFKSMWMNAATHLKANQVVRLGRLAAAQKKFADSVRE